MPGGEKPAGEAAGAKDDKKPGAAEAAKKAPEPVRRPLEPKKPADPSELKVRPDAEGLVTFSFKGQTWPDVLEWLAGISNLNLHWEEVPPGFLDLTTRGKYTPEEARNLLNSVLLAKGFSLLVNGEILVVVNLKSLDVSLVPQVTPAELDRRGKYELARTFFDLDWLIADTLVEELKPILSTHGKAWAMKGAINRLEVLDTVGNLRRIRDMLAEEQSSNTQGRLVRQFKLQYTPASEVLETLNTLLGIQPKKQGPETMTPQQLQMMQQQQQMMMQQQQQAAAQGKALPGAAKNEPQVFLAINVRENSILANAPPDKMAVIEQTISVVDVPTQRGESLLGNVPRVRVYRLTGVAPETLVKVLRDIGGLDPSSRLEIDARNKAIIANAPLADHVMIQTLVERLDGTGRRFEVIQLRVLKAEYVAGSLELLMRGPPETTSRSRYPYYIYDFGYGGSQQQDKADKFQVDADIEHNRLLLRATEAELAEVRELLVKLGEVPETARAGPPVRIIPTPPSAEETQQLLEKLKRIWPSVGPNPLDVEERPTPAGQPESKPSGGQGSPSRAAVSVRPAVATSETLLEPLAASNSDEQPNHESARAPAEAPPVTITIGPQGLILSSPDTRALDQLEDLLESLAPSKSNFRVFALEHTYAKDVALLLKDIFKDETDPKKSSSDQFFERLYFGFSSSDNTPKTRSSLSKRKPLAFVPDPVTNTVLVQYADEQQLAEIERLIKLYDRVEPPDSNSVRRTQMITLSYASAKQVQEVIKDVYRDLLSPNDKALQQAQAQKQQQQQDQQARPFWSYLQMPGEDNEEKNLPRFKGLLSVGVEELTNTLVISAPQWLLNDVVAMAERFDRQAEPMRPVVNVLKLQNSGTSAYLKGTTNGNARRLTPSREPATNGATPTQPQTPKAVAQPGE